MTVKAKGNNANLFFLTIDLIHKVPVFSKGHKSLKNLPLVLTLLKNKCFRQIAKRSFEFLSFMI